MDKSFFFKLFYFFCIFYIFCNENVLINLKMLMYLLIFKNEEIEVNGFWDQFQLKIGF